MQIRPQLWWYVLITCLILTALFFFLPFFQRFRLSFISGGIISAIFLSIGALMIWYKDIHHDKKWFGNFYKENQTLIVTVDEPLAEKARSYKADAVVNFLNADENKIPVTGKIILYFKKDLLSDSLLRKITYGSQITFSKPLQEIKNSGNPGGFDYKKYCLVQEITHQVYLRSDEFTVLPTKNENALNRFLYATREKVIQIIRKNIPGKKEQSLAEALLIGYKNDLDRTLVQSYTNTGVVHLIVIAGLHLGLIYWLLLLMAKPLKRKKYGKWIRPVFVISGLWIFSLLTGAHPPVLRAAVMFTCVMIAESFGKKTSIYNTLSLSAFILLCYNPYWVMDAGFQLSYAAVVSIVTFVKPISDLLYIQNKILDYAWKLMSVSIAAQIFTLPFSIYHFHQFPNYFLITNFLAVPLACMTLIGEVILCMISFVPFLASLTGKILSFMIWVLNSYIERIESLPYSLWDGLYMTIPQTILLIVCIAGISFWLMEKRKTGFKVGMITLFGFVLLRSISFFQTNEQQKIIVYNVPQRQAIDFIDGRKYFFVGDSDLLEDDFLRNFHLKPSRVLHRIEPVSTVNNLLQQDNYFVFRKKKILLLDKNISYSPSEEKTIIDLLIISRNPKIYISALTNSMIIRQIVFDGSAPSWKMNFWKKDCDSLHIPYHDVNEKGAFVMNLR